MKLTVGYNAMLWFHTQNIIYIVMHVLTNNANGTDGSLRLIFITYN